MVSVIDALLSPAQMTPKGLCYGISRCEINPTLASVFIGPLVS
jgi:hypothetical protein